MKLEGVLLTGGASRRMGEDKASLIVHGESMGLRMARFLREVCEQVTVLGREPIPSCAFLADREEFAGPLMSLSAFQPCAQRVLVLSCDLPLMTADALSTLSRTEGTVIPMVGGRPQPLCAIYAADDFRAIPVVVSEGKRSMMAWLDQLHFQAPTPLELGLEEAIFANVNTPEDWRNAVERQSL